MFWDISLCSRAKLHSWYYKRLSPMSQKCNCGFGILCNKIPQSHFFANYLNSTIKTHKVFYIKNHVDKYKDFHGSGRYHDIAFKMIDLITYATLKCHIVVVTCALVVYLIYLPSALRPAALGHQADHSCPCFNYKIYCIYACIPLTLQIKEIQKRVT